MAPTTASGGAGSGGELRRRLVTVGGGSTGGGGSRRRQRRPAARPRSPGGQPHALTRRRPETPSSPEPPHEGAQADLRGRRHPDRAFRTVRYRSISKLTMLPTEAAPVLIFLGVDSVRPEGGLPGRLVTDRHGRRGHVQPRAPTPCATWRSSPARSRLQQRPGRRLQLQIDQIREVDRRGRGQRPTQAGACGRFWSFGRGPPVRAAHDHRPDHRGRRVRLRHRSLVLPAEG